MVWVAVSTGWIYKGLHRMVFRMWLLAILMTSCIKKVFSGEHIYVFFFLLWIFFLLLLSGHPILSIQKKCIRSPVQLYRWKKNCIRSAVCPCYSKKSYIRSAVRFDHSKTKLHPFSRSTKPFEKNLHPFNRSISNGLSSRFLSVHLPCVQPFERIS